MLFFLSFKPFHPFFLWVRASICMNGFPNPLVPDNIILLLPHTLTAPQSGMYLTYDYSPSCPVLWCPAFHLSSAAKNLSKKKTQAFTCPYLPLFSCQTKVSLLQTFHINTETTHLNIRILWIPRVTQMVAWVNIVSQVSGWTRTDGCMPDWQKQFKSIWCLPSPLAFVL